MSAICLGRKRSVSHPEEMPFEKYGLEDSFTHSEKRQAFAYSGLKSCGMRNISACSNRDIYNLLATFYLGKNNKILINKNYYKLLKIK